MYYEDPVVCYLVVRFRIKHCEITNQYSTIAIGELRIKTHSNQNFQSKEFGLSLTHKTHEILKTSYCEKHKENSNEGGGNSGGNAGGNVNSQNSNSNEGGGSPNARKSLILQASTTMKPWPDFAIPLRIPSDSLKAWGSVKSNVSEFRTNYIILFAMYLCSNLLTETNALMVLVMLAMVWYLLHCYHGD